MGNDTVFIDVGNWVVHEVKDTPPNVNDCKLGDPVKGKFQVVNVFVPPHGPPFEVALNEVRPVGNAGGNEDIPTNLLDSKQKIVKQLMRESFLKEINNVTETS